LGGPSKRANEKDPQNGKKIDVKPVGIYDRIRGVRKEHWQLGLEGKGFREGDRKVGGEAQLKGKEKNPY